MEGDVSRDSRDRRWTGEGCTGASTIEPRSQSSRSRNAPPFAPQTVSRIKSTELGREQQKSDSVPAFNFSFAVGGWLMFYNFGVAKCLMDHELHKVHPSQKLFGSSAGSLAAAGLALEADFDGIMDMVKTSFVPQTHAAKLLGFFVYGIFFIKHYLKECLLKHLPMDKVRDLPHGKLTVVMSTMMTWDPIRVSQFTSGRDLMEALLASCAAFPLVLPQKWRGKLRLDGFYSEGGSPPFVSEEVSGGLRTVYISPFYTSGATIRPSRYIPLWWMSLPPKDINTVDWLYDLGYRDALHWMSQEGLGHACTHQPRWHQKSSRTHRGDASGLKGGEHGGGGGAAADPGPAPADTGGTQKPPPSPVKPGARLSARTKDNSSSGGGSSTRKYSTAIVGTGGSSAPEEPNNLPRPAPNGGNRASFMLGNCQRRPPRLPHFFDERKGREPSLVRLLGGQAQTTNLVLDVIFAAIFHCLWKPTTALLIYLDVVAMATYVAILGTIVEVRATFPPAAALLLPLAMDPPVVHHHPVRCLPLVIALGLLVMRKIRLQGPQATRQWHKLRGHVSTLLNHRLLLRCLPWMGEGVDPKSHLHRDFKTSLLYRAALHFI